MTGVIVKDIKYIYYDGSLLKDIKYIYYDGFLVNDIISFFIITIVSPLHLL